MHSAIGDDRQIARLVSEADLAVRYGRTVRTLQRWRREGTGPVWMKIGAGVFYRLEDVEGFEDAARREMGK